MRRFERRLAEIEKRAPAESFALQLSRLLASYPPGPERDAVIAELAKGHEHYISSRKLPDPIERGLAWTLFLTVNRDPFVLEHFRGLVPDRVIQAVYSSMRNWGKRPVWAPSLGT